MPQIVHITFYNNLKLKFVCLAAYLCHQFLQYIMQK